MKLIVILLMLLSFLSVCYCLYINCRKTIGVHQPSRTNIAFRVAHRIHQSSSFSYARTRLFESASNSVESNARKPKPLITARNVNVVNRAFNRASWIAWWAQIILTVISGVILTFANAVRPVGTKSGDLWMSGFVFSTMGVATALVNMFWTWNITRLCRRITRQKMEEARSIVLLRRYAQISVFISLVGTFFALLGAEQIVGTLVSKILTASSYGQPFSAAMVVSTTPIHAVDIFLVQANTNSLLSHFVGLVCYLWLLQTRLKPSTSTSTSTSMQQSPSSLTPKET